MAAKKWRPAEPNRHRVAVAATGDNFGLIQIEWDAPAPRVGLQISDDHGETVIREKLDLAVLKRGVFKQRTTVASNATPSAGTVGPAEAAKHLNEKVTLEMTVRAVGGSRDKSMAFLNSSANFRDKDNFTVVLPMGKLADALKAKGIEDPITLKGKTVRVTGTVALFREAPQIVVEDAEQLAVVP
jgi:hypothetical protein